MRNKGFTLIEIIIVVAIIGVLAAICISIISPTPEARVIACQADMAAYHSSIETMRETGSAPTWEQVQQELPNWKDHYHYLVNNSDPNAGHGNDLDNCDEENPGSSSENRECLEIDYIIICDHDHYRAGVKYNAMVESWYTPDPFAVPLDTIDNSKPSGPGKAQFLQRGNDHEFLKDIYYWRLKDPNWQKWIGRTN